MFDLDAKGEGQARRVIRKLPYKYSYKFLSEGDTKPRTLMIEDWEIGALYWNCLNDSNGDEEEANRRVRQKYLDEFVEKMDVYFFVGTTLRYHRLALNPFVIIGVFRPPKLTGPEQLSLF